MEGRPEGLTWCAVGRKPGACPSATGRSTIVKGEPLMPMKILGPLLDAMVGRSVTADDRRIEELLEVDA